MINILLTHGLSAIATGFAIALTCRIFSILSKAERNWAVLHSRLFYGFAVSFIVSDLQQVWQYYIWTHSLQTMGIKLIMMVVSLAALNTARLELNKGPGGISGDRLMVYLALPVVSSLLGIQSLIFAIFRM